MNHAIGDGTSLVAAFLGLTNYFELLKEGAPLMPEKTTKRIKQDVETMSFFEKLRFNLKGIAAGSLINRTKDAKSSLTKKSNKRVIGLSEKIPVVSLQETYFVFKHPGLPVILAESQRHCSCARRPIHG